MRDRRNKGRLPVFVPLFKDTMSSPAWRATSHGARSLFTALKSHYNRTVCGGVYLSARRASKELGSNKDYITRWFRELEFYGFIVMISAGCLASRAKAKRRIGDLPTNGSTTSRRPETFTSGTELNIASKKALNGTFAKNRIPSLKLGTHCPLKWGQSCPLKWGHQPVRLSLKLGTYLV